MNEYYADFVAGQIGGVSAVDGVGSLLLATGDLNGDTVFIALRQFFIWFFSAIPDFSSWIRSTPAVMALAAIFFFGCVVALFMRLYHSIL